MLLDDLTEFQVESGLQFGIQCDQEFILVRQTRIVAHGLVDFVHCRRNETPALKYKTRTLWRKIVESEAQSMFRRITFMLESIRLTRF